MDLAAEKPSQRPTQLGLRQRSQHLLSVTCFANPNSSFQRDIGHLNMVLHSIGRENDLITT
jgi:hypothetical protein